MNQATSQTSRKPTPPRLIDELVLLLEQQRVDVRAKERRVPPGSLTRLVVGHEPLNRREGAGVHQGQHGGSGSGGCLARRPREPTTRLLPRPRVGAGGRDP